MERYILELNNASLKGISRYLYKDIFTSLLRVNLILHYNISIKKRKRKRKACHDILLAF